MSFLSGLFGRTKYEPTTRTVQTVSKLPEEIAPYVTDILEDAQAQYDKAVAEGYQPYGQETIAPRTPEEEEAIAGLRSLIGGQGKYIDEAEAALRGIDTEFTAEAAQKFMSPYQQAVTDIEKRKAQEDFQRRIMPQFEQQAVEAGGMSGLGSRAGVQAARLGSAFSQQLGDIQAKGQQKAYEDAYRQFTDQATRKRAQATDLQNLGLTRFQTGLAEQGLAQQLAQEDRQEAQNILDKKFIEYLEREQFPQQKLAEYSGLVYGNPLAKITDTTRTESGFRAPNAPGIGQQLLGLGLSGLNVFGMGGGFSPGGFKASNIWQGGTRMPRKTGGRVVQRQEGGRLPVVKRSRPGRIGYGLFGRQGLFGTRFGLGGGLAGALNNAYSQGMQMGTSGQGNLVENIQSAGRDLVGLRGSADRHVQAITAAAKAIGDTLNSTLGGGLSQEAITDITTPTTPVDQAPVTDQAPVADIATPKEVAMKAGGGLGSLPVVERQISGRTKLTEREKQLLGAYSGVYGNNLSSDLRARINKQDEAPMVPPPSLTERQKQLLKAYGGVSGDNPALKRYGDQFKGLNFSDFGETINVERLPAYSNLRSNLISDVPDQYGTATPNQPTTLAEAKSQLPSTDPTGLTGLRPKIKGANVDIMNRLLKRAKEIGEQRDVDRATFEAMPGANLATRKKVLQIKNAGNKRLAAQEATNITELDKTQKGFADADKKALDDYEKDKTDRLEKARQAWPGEAISEAINAAMDQPSLVTFLSKAMNLSVAGISKRNEKINDKMDKLKDVMFEKETELRGKNEQRKLNVLDKKQTNLINGILRDTEFKASLAELPVKYRTEVITSIKSLAALDASKDTTLINIAKVLTNILKETGSESKVTGKSFEAQEKAVVNRIKERYGFTVDPNNPNSLFIDGKPISKDDPNYQKMLKEINTEVRMLLEGMAARGGTGYGSQLGSRLDVIRSQQNQQPSPPPNTQNYPVVKKGMSFEKDKIYYSNKYGPVKYTGIGTTPFVLVQ